MSLLTVVQDVCAVVGVQAPTSVLASINSNRTMFEMLSLANEMAQRIAYNTREWRQLKATATFVGDGLISNTTGLMVGTELFPLPSNYQRLLLTSDVWRSTSGIQPMMFVADDNEWMQRRLRGYINAWGEWRLIGSAMDIWPIMSAGGVPWQNSFQYLAGTEVYDVIDNTVWRALVEHTSPATGLFSFDRANNPGRWVATGAIRTPVTATFNYLDKNCINLSSGGRGDAFVNDIDTFVLDERLLKLGMIWQWKANKGSPYAEDMATWQDALMVAQGADRPAPILVGRKPISWSSRASYPFPIDPGMRPM